METVGIRSHNQNNKSTFAARLVLASSLSIISPSGDIWLFPSQRHTWLWSTTTTAIVAELIENLHFRRVALFDFAAMTFDALLNVSGGQYVGLRGRRVRCDHPERRRSVRGQHPEVRPQEKQISDLNMRAENSVSTQHPDAFWEPDVRTWTATHE